jgi:predicted dithiol-disulfide oxidoreductase (DUF899 family)
MTLPAVTSREDWLAARRKLLVLEKELTRHQTAVNAERRRLPWSASRRTTFSRVPTESERSGTCSPAAAS